VLFLGNDVKDLDIRRITAVIDIIGLCPASLREARRYFPAVCGILDSRRETVFHERFERARKGALVGAEIVRKLGKADSVGLSVSVKLKE
jgi:hypothetical protein